MCVSEKAEPVKMAPMLAKPGKLPDDPGNYGFEIKWDGIRAIAHVSGRGVLVQSRNLKDITRQYPELKPLAKTLENRNVIIDGELVAFDANGHPSFASLQHRMGLSSDKAVKLQKEKYPVIYMIFDILYLDGKSVMMLPYTERRAILQGLGLHSEAWQTPAYRPGAGRLLQEASQAFGLEGVVAKRLDSTYEAGKRTGAWIKIKNQQRQELIIAGWVPGRGRRSGSIGAVLTGYYDVSLAEAEKRGKDQQLIYSGKVGSGFSNLMLSQLAEAFKILKRDENPFSTKIPHPDAVFLEPRLIGEFEFSEWTDQHTLRHPSFKGLRTDKNPTEVIRE